MFKKAFHLLALVACTFSLLLLPGKSALAETVTGPFDAMTVFPNGKLYVTKGNMYWRYSGSNAAVADPGYPKPIAGNWDVPASFTSGFDTASVFPNGKLYVTKGDEYMRFSGSNAAVADPGYPKPIAGNWDVPASFTSGFDTASVFPNGKLYVTKGDEYVRFSGSNAAVSDSNYPRPIAGNWDVPASFTSGFDAATVFPNGRLYVTKGDEYVRFSGSNAAVSDSGYPKSIAGDWG